jgi:hypothetical protein
LDEKLKNPGDTEIRRPKNVAAHAQTLTTPACLRKIIYTTRRGGAPRVALVVVE